METNCRDFKILTFNELESEYSNYINEAFKHAALSYNERIAFFMHPFFHRNRSYKAFAVYSTVAFLFFSVLCTAIFMMFEGENYREKTKMFQNEVQQQNDMFCKELSKQFNLSNCNEPFIDEQLLNYRIFLYKHHEEMYTEQSPWPWTFHHTFGFVLWVFLTIGDGKMYPVTIAGRLSCIILSIIGIPLFLLVTAYYGVMIYNLLNFLYHKKLQKLFGRTLQKNSQTLIKVTVSKVTDEADLVSFQASVERAQLKSFIKKSAIPKKPKIKKIKKGTVLKVRNLNNKLNNTRMPKTIKLESTTKQKPIKKTKIIQKENEKSSKSKTSVLGSPDVPSEERYKESRSRTRIIPNSGKIRPRVLPVKVSITILFTYMILGATILMRQLEGWNFIQALYHIYVTLTTIGFGDIDPWPVLTNTHYFYVFLGTSLVAMVLESIKESLRQQFSFGINKLFVPTKVIPIAEDLYLVPYDTKTRQVNEKPK